jgi:hypothetical protein
MNNFDEELEKIQNESSPSSSEYSTVLSNSSPTNHNIDIHNTESIEIENIQEERNLIDYTNNHFTNKLYEDLRNENVSVDDIDHYDNRYIRSNSPISMSNSGSNANSPNGSFVDYNNGSGSDSDSDPIVLNTANYTYYDIEKNLDKYYDNISDNRISNEIDILITYVKGQKHLYTHSKNIIQWKLNLLMFPALFLTASITIIAPFIECHPWSVGTISAINAAIAFLISLMNYLKYESSIESHLQMANQFDKLETFLDLTNSKLLILDNDIDKRNIIFQKMNEFEKRLNEIKHFNKVMIPEEVKILFPIISHIQIFSFIKKIDNCKKNLLVKYKDVNKEIKYIVKKWKKLGNNNDINKLKETQRLNFLYDIKDKIKNEIITYKNIYTHIDDMFSKEIYNAENKKNFFCKKKNDNNIVDPISKYINFNQCT